MIAVTGLTPSGQGVYVETRDAGGGLGGQTVPLDRKLLGGESVQTSRRLRSTSPSGCIAYIAHELNYKCFLDLPRC